MSPASVAQGCLGGQRGPGSCITAWKPAWLPAGGVLAAASVCAGPDRDRAPLPPGGTRPARSLLLPVHVQCCSFSTGGTPPRPPTATSVPGEFLHGPAPRARRSAGISGGSFPEEAPGRGRTVTGRGPREPPHEPESQRSLEHPVSFSPEDGASEGDGFASLHLSDNNPRAFLRSLRGFVENREGPGWALRRGKPKTREGAGESNSASTPQRVRLRV